MKRSGRALEEHSAEEYGWAVLVVSVDVKDRGRDVHPTAAFEALAARGPALAVPVGWHGRPAPLPCPQSAAADARLLALSLKPAGNARDRCRRRGTPALELAGRDIRRRELAGFLLGLIDFQVMRLHRQMLGVTIAP